MGDPVCRERRDARHHVGVLLQRGNHTTTGYGDVVLPQAWRLHGGIEALTGILMCGWSTGFFFAIVNRLYVRQA